MEDGVCRAGPYTVDAPFLSCFHGRSDVCDLLGSKEAIVSVVRIQPGNGDQRILDAHLAKFFVNVDHVVQDHVLGGVVTGVYQGHMPADEEDSQLMAGKHGQRVR